MFQQREIKFRLHDSDGAIIGYETHEPNEFGVVNIWHETLRGDWDGPPKGLVRKGYFIPAKFKGQYTGLKDRNGVEIYEGDMLQFVGTMKTEPFLMGWDAERCSYTNFSPRDRVEVIGNIFQNPELLPAQ